MAESAAHESPTPSFGRTNTAVARSAVAGLASRRESVIARSVSGTFAGFGEASAYSLMLPLKSVAEILYYMLTGASSM